MAYTKCVRPNFLCKGLNIYILYIKLNLREQPLLNCHYTHIWSDGNSHAITKSRHQYNFPLNVWAGIGDNYLFVWFLPFKHSMVKDIYIFDDLSPSLEDALLNTTNSMCFRNGDSRKFQFQCS